MAINLVSLVSETLVSWNFLILIIGGLLAASWLFVRFAGVSTDDLSSTVNRLSIIGFPVGVIALITIGAGLYLWSNDSSFIETYNTFDLVTIICLGILGLVLILRPIKDFKFGALISLAVGLLGSGILVFFGAGSVQIFAIVFIILFFIIYLSTKLFEDLYLLIAETLSSPIISITVGIFCIIQGVLEILGFSIGGIIALFLTG